MSAPSSPSKRTAGEELFLVHLRRTNSPHHDHAEDEDDHDYEIPRKRSRSIGEELFLAHLKRSEGLEPDYDTDPEVNASNASDAKGKDAAAEKKAAAAVSKKKTSTDDVKTTDAMETDDNVMHLRDGRIILHKSQ
jgi:hypothetical protein